MISLSRPWALSLRTALRLSEELAEHQCLATSVKHQALAFYLKLIDLPWQKKKSKITGRYKQRHQKRPCKVTVEVGFQPGNTHTHIAAREPWLLYLQFALLSYIIIKYNVSDLCFPIRDFLKKKNYLLDAFFPSNNKHLSKAGIWKSGF